MRGGIFEFPTDAVVTWQSTFSNRHYRLGERLLGSDGTMEHIAGATDMVTGKSLEHFGLTLSESQDHMANWIDCIRTRKTPNAPVEMAIVRQQLRTWLTGLPAAGSSSRLKRRERLSLSEF